MTVLSGCLNIVAKFLELVDELSCCFPLANRVLFFMPLPPRHQELATTFAVLACVFVVVGFRKLPMGFPFGCAMAIPLFLVAFGVTVFYLFIDAQYFPVIDWILYILIFPSYTAAFASLSSSTQPSQAY
jgi:hypothetical protein